MTGSYFYASHPDGNRITGRLYDRLHDQFQLNAARLTFLKAPTPNKLDAGFQVDLLFGQNAPQIRSAGLSLGTTGICPKAFVSLNVPTGPESYLRFSAGKRWTMMDVEYVDEILNPNFSHGYAYIYVSNFTDTGLSLDAHFSSKVELGLRVINGWDVVEDNNTKKSFMGRLALTPSDRVALSFLGYRRPGAGRQRERQPVRRPVRRHLQAGLDRHALHRAGRGGRGGPRRRRREGVLVERGSVGRLRPLAQGRPGPAGRLPG